MRLSVLPLATLGVLAGGSALGQSPSPALGQGWAGELWSRGGAASSDAAGSTGAGLLDGSLSYSFDNGLTAKAELEGNGLLGSDGAGGTVQAWWEDPSLGLIGAFAEASRSDGLWQRRFVLQGELYLGPFTLRGQAGIAPPDKEGSRELQGGFFGLISGGWYPLDALGLNLGASTQGGRGLVFGNVEWAPGFLPQGGLFTLDAGAGPGGSCSGSSASVSCSARVRRAPCAGGNSARRRASRVMWSGHSGSGGLRRHRQQAAVRDRPEAPRFEGPPAGCPNPKSPHVAALTETDP